MECNGLRITYITDSVYRSEHGYFMFRDDSQEWVFTPLEKDFNVDVLLSIMDALRNFNESKTINFSKSDRS
jgi:hypothetical protein